MESQQLQCSLLLCRIKCLWFALRAVGWEPPKRVPSQRQELDPGMPFFPLALPEALSPRLSQCFLSFPWCSIFYWWLLRFLSITLGKKKSILDGDPINIDRKKSVEFIEMTSNGLFLLFFLNFIILKMHCMDKMVPELYAGTVTSNGMHVVKCFSYGLAKEQVVEGAGRNGA